jgi:DNA-binding response OmpR family regulator
MDAGFDSVIGKPYLKEDLVACIQTAVTRGGFSSTNR